jgi:hypothetical protein
MFDVATMFIERDVQGFDQEPAALWHGITARRNVPEGRAKLSGLDLYWLRSGVHDVENMTYSPRIWRSTSMLNAVKENADYWQKVLAEHARYSQRRTNFSPA